MVILPLAGFLCCAVTALFFGIATIRALAVRASLLETVSLGYLLGCAVTSTVSLVLALLGAALPAIYISLGVISLAGLWAQRKWLIALPRPAWPDVPLYWRLLIIGALAVYGLVYFRQAAAPEISADGAAYHLGLVNLWANAGRLYRIEDMYAGLPQGVEMLYLFAFTIGRHSAAALVHLSFLFTLPLLMLSYGRRCGWNLVAAGFAALLVFASPLIGMDGTVAYNDVALAAVVFSALYLLRIWFDESAAGALVACGISAGYAMTIKYPAALLFLLIAVLVLLRTRNLRALAMLTAPAAFLLSFYLIRNWIWYWNPIAFFGNAIFRNPFFHVSLERSFFDQNAHPPGIRWRDLPLGLTVGTAKLPAGFGPAFLLIPVSFLGLFRRETRQFTLAALVLGLVIFTQKSDARFLIPAVPPAAMAAAFVLTRVRGSAVMLWVIAVAHLVLSFPGAQNVVPVTQAWQWRIVPVTWAQAFLEDSRAAYLSHFPDYEMARRIDELVPAGERILTFTGGEAQSYTSGFVVVCWRSAFGERAADFFFSNWHSPEDQRQRVVFQFDRKNLKQIQIAQTGAAANAMWNVDEIQLKNKASVIPASDQWILSASPNPWDVRLAFDGNPVTRWRSWEDLRPGMEISAVFPKPQEVDEVDVLMDNREWTTLGGGPWPARVSLKLTDSDGHETTIDPAIAYEPAGDLRRAAAKAVTNLGLRYVLINSGDWEQDQFRGMPEAWNMHPIASTEEATLYKLD